MTERLEVQRAIAADPAAIFRVVSDPHGHVTIDSSGMLMDATGDPAGQTAATANVNFDYDAAGNRTSMSDGLGSATYVFNNLGQMQSETRSFSGLVRGTCRSRFLWRSGEDDER